MAANPGRLGAIHAGGARVVRNRPFAYRAAHAPGPRLGRQPSVLLHFQRWLEKNGLLRFHHLTPKPAALLQGERVKQWVHLPDWTFAGSGSNTPTACSTCWPNCLPAGAWPAASAVLLVCSRNLSPGLEKLAAIRRPVHACVEHIAEDAARWGRDLHLGDWNPEPVWGCGATPAETVDFFDRLREGTSRRFPRPGW